MKRLLCLILLIFFQISFSQVSSHTVKEGETISKIAVQYKVTPFDLYKLNPDAQTGVRPGMVLLIPKSVVATTPKEVSNEKNTTPEKTVETKPAIIKPIVKPSSSNAQTHTVKSKESLYGISKMYSISIEELEKNNPQLKEVGLQPGQELVIKKGANQTKVLPNEPLKTPKETAKPSVTPTNNIVLHEVKPKETKYGIATQYGITVEELENQNPEIKDNLPIGFQLKINKNGKSASSQPEKKVPVVTKEITTKPKQELVKQKEEVVKPKQEPIKVKEISTSKTNGQFNYTVKDGDTFYSLTRLFGITQEKLTEMNPSLKDGLKEGMILNIPADITTTTTITTTTSTNSTTTTPYKPSTNLLKTISKTNKKHLALLIPFNMSKIEMDTIKSLNSKFKDDKFLNMTLDF